MSAQTMAKGKRAKKQPPKEEHPDDEVTIKVYRSERPLVNQAAGARNETVAEMFRSIEMQTFLTHLMAAAAARAEKRLEEQRPKPT